MKNSFPRNTTLLFDVLFKWTHFLFLIIDNPYNNPHIVQVYPFQNDTIPIGANEMNFILTIQRPR